MKLIYILLGLSLLASCHSENEEDLFPPPLVPPPDTTMMTTVSFASQISPLMASRCTNPGCHVPGGPGNGLLRNYNEIRLMANSGKINNRIVVERTMPPSGPLPSNEIKLIKDWLDEGALNN